MACALALPEPIARALHSGRELARRRSSDTASRLHTGIEPVDALLGGGLRRGDTVELVGRVSSGRFSLLLATLAAATARGEAAALVDLGDALDPQAAHDAGVDLDRLLWVRPRTSRELLASGEAILGCGMPMVVVDLGLPPVPGGRGKEAAWLRLARAARARDAVLVVASPYRVSGTAATTVLQLDDRRAVWRGRARGRTPQLLDGLSTRLDVHKRRGHRPGASAGFALRLIDGVVPATDGLARPKVLPLAPPRRPEAAPGSVATPSAARARAIA